MEREKYTLYHMEFPNRVLMKIKNHEFVYHEFISTTSFLVSMMCKRPPSGSPIGNLDYTK